VGYVYGDLWFSLNFTVDLGLLWLAGRAAGLRTSPGRLVLAAALGGTYGLGYLLPDLGPFYSPGAIGLFSLFIVGVAFAPAVAAAGRAGGPWAGVGALTRAAAGFYLGGLSMAGGVLAAQQLESRLPATPGWLWSLPAPGVASLLGALAVTAGAIGLVRHVAGRRRWLEQALVPTEVVVGAHRATLRALVDTGNMLRDPLSRAPVVIVSYPAIRNLLPPDICAVYEEPRRAASPAGRGEAPGPDLGQLAAVLSASRWGTRFRVVPFQSLGAANGLLLGFRPDLVVLREGGRDVRVRDVVVCVHHRPLSVAGEYEALVPPELLEAA